MTQSQVALVTGSSRGIGRAVAEAFAGEGATLILAGRDVAALDEVRDVCLARGAGQVRVAAFDVTDEAACGQAVDGTVAEFGRLDVLVNNAGVASSSKFTELSLEVWRTTMAVDVEGPFLLMRAALPHMLRARRGAIINIASLAARMGGPYVAAYTAAKHALLGLTRSVAAEYSTTGITVNCVCPWYVDTPMTQQTIANIMRTTGRTHDEAIAGLLSPQGRLIAPEEVAELCLLLAGPAGRSITGQALNVDGGRHQG